MNAVIQFVTWKGKISRSYYLVAVSVLLALLYNLDRIFIESFLNLSTTGAGFGWTQIGERTSSPEFLQLCIYLLGLFIPSAWLGVCLTVRRLRDAGLSLWFVVLLGLPIINLLFVATLCLLPSGDESELPGGFEPSFRRFVPVGKVGAAMVAVLLTVPVAVFLVWTGTQISEFYGWALFVATPFFLGFSSVLIAGIHSPHGFGYCMTVATWSIVITGLLMVAVALEGVLCVIMALHLESLVECI